jgi:hypothetical protein
LISGVNKRRILNKTDDWERAWKGKTEQSTFEGQQIKCSSFVVSIKLKKCHKNTAINQI